MDVKNWALQGIAKYKKAQAPMPIQKGWAHRIRHDPSHDRRRPNQETKCLGNQRPVATKMGSITWEPSSSNGLNPSKLTV